MTGERNAQRAREVRATCARLGLTIQEDRNSYLIRGRGVHLRVAYLSVVRDGDLEPARTGLSRESPGVGFPK